MKKTAKIVVALLLAMVMVLTMFAAVACDNPEEDPCKDGHRLKAVQRKEATTEAAGYEAYWECQDCHKKFSDAEGKNEIQKPVELPQITGPTTLTYNIATIADDNEWANSTGYLEFPTGDTHLTITAAGTPVKAEYGLNTGKYYENGENWRFYQNENCTLTFTVGTGYKLVSIKITYVVKNGGILQVVDGNTVESAATYEVTTAQQTTCVFTCGQTGTASNGNFQISEIVVTYTAA